MLCWIEGKLRGGFKQHRDWFRCARVLIFFTMSRRYLLNISRHCALSVYVYDRIYTYGKLFIISVNSTNDILTNHACSVCFWTLNTLLTLSAPVPYLHTYIWHTLDLHWVCRCPSTCMFNTITIHSADCKIMKFSIEIVFVVNAFKNISLTKKPLSLKSNIRGLCWSIHTFYVTTYLCIFYRCVYLLLATIGLFSWRSNLSIPSIASNSIAPECTLNYLAISGDKMASPWARATRDI